MSLGDKATILQTLAVHTSDVTSVDISSNFILVSGSGDKSVRVWEWTVGEGYKEKAFSPLLGHKYGVTCVRISPQGSMLASSSIDGTAILWNLHSGTKIHTFVQVGGDAIRVCRFSPDSYILVTAGDNGALCVWDLVHRSLIRTIFEHEGTTQALSFTPDSEYLISACSLEIIRVWSTKSILDTTSENACNSIAYIDNAHDLGILSVDVSNKITTDENDVLTKKYTLATGGNSDAIKIWSLTSTLMKKQDSCPNRVRVEYLNTFTGHTCAVTCVKYNQSGNWLISASLDKSIKIWDEEGTCLASFIGHKRYINTVSIARDSSIIISGSNDRSLIIWDVFGNLSKECELRRSHTLLSSLIQPSNTMQEVQMVQIAESDDSFKLIEKIDDISDGAINTCCFYNDSLLATGSSDKLVRLFQLQTPGLSLEELQSSPIDGHTYVVNNVMFSKDGSKLATCSQDGYAYVWNPMTGEKLNTIPEQYQAIRAIVFSPDDTKILLAGDDEIGVVWDLESMTKLYTLEGHADSITSASYTIDGQLIATSCSNGDYRLWLEEIPIYVNDSAHDLGTQCCDFSENLDPIPNQIATNQQNYLLATCGNDSFVKLWWISIPRSTNNLIFQEINVKLYRSLRGHGGSVISVKFSPKNGEIACSTGTDRQARIWSTYSGDCIHVLDHDAITTCCAFNESCSLLSIGCIDKTLWLWKLPITLIFQTAVANKINKRTKSVAEWSVREVSKWLQDIGLKEISEIVLNTSLDGHKLLTLSEERICSGLDLSEENGEKLTKEIQWLKKDQLRENLQIVLPEDIPFEFLCPITHEIMLEPVTCSDGFTYERKAITEWFMSGKFTSPMTNEALLTTDFQSNIELRLKIHNFLYSDNE